MSIMSYMKNQKPILGSESDSNIELNNSAQKKQIDFDKIMDWAGSHLAENSEDDFFCKKSKKFSCVVCNITFASKTSMIEHAKSEHPNYINSGSKPLKNVCCMECNKSLSSKYSLLHHMKSVHNYILLQEKQKKCKKFFCTECKGGFTEKKSLRTHVLRFHQGKPCTQFPAKKPLRHQCDECKICFSEKRTLNVHMSKIHGTDSKVIVNCPKCKLNFDKGSINDHFDFCHNIKIKTTKLNFDSLEKFYEWKNKVEMLTNIKFITNSRSGGSSYKNCTKLFFKCHRSGSKRKYSGVNRIKPTCRLRSIKMNSYCPASIKVIKSPAGNCTVFFQSTHVGHDEDLEVLFHSNEEVEPTTDLLDTNESAAFDPDYNNSDIHKSAAFVPDFNDSGTHESAAFDPDFDDSDTHDSECDFILKYLAQNPTQIDSFEENRNNLLFRYTNLIKSLSRPEQLDIMEKTIKFLIPKLSPVDSFEKNRNNLLFKYTNFIKFLSSQDQLDLMERTLKFLIPKLSAVKHRTISISLSH